jgi:hypothetical protein
MSKIALLFHKLYSNCSISNNIKLLSANSSISLLAKIYFYATGTAQYGLIQYTVDPTGVCYHRFFCNSPHMHEPIENWLAQHPNP